MNDLIPAVGNSGNINPEESDAKDPFHSDSNDSLANGPDRSKQSPLERFGENVPKALVIYSVVTICIFLLLCLINCFSPTRSTPRIIQDGSKVASEAIKLKEYELHISLFQYYLTLGFSAFTFFCVMTGSILAYILKNYEENPVIKLGKGKIRIQKFSLLLPILVSSVFVSIFAYGAWSWHEVRGGVETLRDDLGIQKVPDLQILLQMLVLFSGILFLIGTALLTFFFSSKEPNSDDPEAAAP